MSRITPTTHMPVTPSLPEQASPIGRLPVEIATGVVRSVAGLPPFQEDKPDLSAPDPSKQAARALAPLKRVNKAWAALAQHTLNQLPEAAMEASRGAFLGGRNITPAAQLHSYFKSIVEKYRHLAVPLYALPMEKGRVLLDVLSDGETLKARTSIELETGCGDENRVPFNEFLDAVARMNTPGKDLRIHLSLYSSPFHFCAKEDASALSAVLSDPHTKVVECNANMLRLGDDGARVFAEALASPNCKLEKVQLSENALGPRGVEYIAEALRISGHTECDLSINDAGNLGATHLAATLQLPTCAIRRWDLSANSIHSEGVQALANALQQPGCHATHCDLGYNPIGTAGVQHIAQALRSPDCKLEELGLEQTDMTDADLTILLEALTDPNCKLKRLNLGSNLLTAAGIAALAETLQHENVKIEALNLSSLRQAMNIQALDALIAAFENPACTVTEIDLDGNALGNEGAKRLAAAFRSADCRITKCSLASNGITETGALALAAAFVSPSCAMRTCTDLLAQNLLSESSMQSLEILLKAGKSKTVVS